MTKFKVGDRVKAFGLTGTVLEIDENNTKPIVVLFIHKHSQRFLADGRLEPQHSEPSLVLVTKAPTMVKRKLYLAVKTLPNFHSTRPSHETSSAYASRADAENVFLVPFQIVEVEILIEAED